MKLKSLILTISLFCLSSCNNIANAQLAVFYKDSLDRKVNLTDESYYDIEQKPTMFFIEDNNIQPNRIYIVEIYRLISSENNAQKHFYKSFSLTSSELSEGINLKGIFTEVTSPFIQTEGFIISVCKTEKKSYLNLNDKNQCLLNKEFRVLSGI